MEIIRLPTVDPDTSLSESIEALKSADRAALVIAHAQRPTVVDVDLILHALRQLGDVRVGRVKPRLRAVLSPAQEPASKLMRGARAFDTEQLLDAERAAYVVTRFVRGEAELLARHETYAYLIGKAPIMWRCTKNAYEVWLTHELVNNRCRRDGEPVVRV